MARRSAILITALVAALVGAGIGVMEASNEWFVIALAFPLALAIGLKRPEWVFATFLYAGAFKNVVSVPFDLTVIMAVAVIILAFIEVSKNGFPTMSWPTWSFVGLVLVVLAGAFITSSTDYGVEKAIRFFGLGSTAFFGAMILLREERSVVRFMDATIVIGLIMAADAVTSPSQLETGRLQAFGANTIALGRAAAVAIAGIAVRILWKPFLGLVGVPLMIMSLWALAGSGSRGPTVAVAISLGLLISYRLWTRGASTTVILGFGAAMSSLAGVAWSYIPRASAARFESILGGVLGSSEISRLTLYARALALVRENPIRGVGTGNFSRYGANQYPHNMILEVWSENGTIGVVLLLSCLFAALVNALRAIVRRPGLASDFLLVSIVLAFVNAMVSGDLNDNRLLWALMGASLVSNLWVSAGEQADQVDAVSEPSRL